MANPKSLMTDRSWQLVTAIRATMAGHASTAEIIEMALSAYLHQNAEYAPQPDARPWTDAGTPPDNWRDVEILLNGYKRFGYYGSVEDDRWAAYKVGDLPEPKNIFNMDEDVHPTAWREIDAAAPSTELQGD